MVRPGMLVLATALLGAATPALAQSASNVEVSIPGSQPPALLQPRPPTRIIIRPSRPAKLDRRAYRQCEDWYETEYRPSGTVIVPKMRCWWVRG